MSIRRRTVCLAIACLWLVGGTAASAATIRAITHAAEKQPAAASAHKIQRMAQIVRSFDGQTLQLTNGKKYDLQNVQVSDFSGKDKGPRTAEMTFVDKKLKEVVIKTIKK